MGSVENLDYIEDNNAINHQTSRDVKILESVKQNSSKINSLVIKIGTGMDNQSHVSSPASVRDRVSQVDIDSENVPYIKIINRAASTIQPIKQLVRPYSNY